MAKFCLFRISYRRFALITRKDKPSKRSGKLSKWEQLELIIWFPSPPPFRIWNEDENPLKVWKERGFLKSTGATDASTSPLRHNRGSYPRGMVGISSFDICNGFSSSVAYQAIASETKSSKIHCARMEKIKDSPRLKYQITVFTVNFATWYTADRINGDPVNKINYFDSLID